MVQFCTFTVAAPTRALAGHNDAVFTTLNPLSGHTDAVFCVDATSEGVIFSGSADRFKRESAVLLVF